MYKEYLKFLVCPVCKKDLEIKILNPTEEEIIFGYLDCRFCGKSFEIKEGIPYLVPEIFEKTTRYQEWKEKQERGEKSYLEDEKSYKKYSDNIAKEFAKWSDFKGLLLDIGCGIWSLPVYAEFIKPPNAFWGTDPLKGRPKRFPFVVAVGEYLPFRDKQFDQCICATTLDHVIDPLRIILEGKRVLKDEGEFFIWVGVFGGSKRKDKISKFFSLMRKRNLIFSLKKAIKYFLEILKTRILLLLNKPLDKLHFYYFSEEDMEKLLKRVGLKIKNKKLIDNSLFIKAIK